MKAAIQAMTAAIAERPQSVAGSKMGRPAMKQPRFNWEAEDKYSKLKKLRLEVSNIISTDNTPQAEQLAIVKNWLGRKSLQFIELLTHVQKHRCNTLDSLFEILTNKFRPQFNETIKSLQSCKFSRWNRENAEEWMGRLLLSVIECNCKELNRQLKQQFIHGLNDTDMCYIMQCHFMYSYVSYLSSI